MDEEAIEELIRRGDDSLDEDLALLGIYIDDKSVIGRDGADGPEFALALNGVLGRLAFSARVQDPEGNATDEAFARLTEELDKQDHDTTHATFEQYRQNYLANKPARENPDSE